GTAVSFTTTGGVIQASATTDKDGQATVDLISANPRPANGVAIITAKTVGDSGTTISRSIPVIFSSRTRIIAPSTAFEIPDSGEYNFVYKVQDINGNPLVGGSTIVVTASGPGARNLVVEGDGNVTLPDTDDPSFTSFSVKIRDTKSSDASGPVTIKISVKSQNGDATYSFDGTVKPGEAVVAVPPTARQPSQIAFINVTTRDVFVAGVGATENSVLTYEVRDSLGAPIDKLRRVYAKFDLQFFANTYVRGGTYPKVIPGADSTDDVGRLRASIISGSQAGVVQLVARIELPNGKIILSQPEKITIHAGFPDQAHFSLLQTRYVFPGLGFFNSIRFNTVVGDTFSNPVQEKTPVYYHSWAGVMQTGINEPFSNYTKLDGTAFANLYTVNPLPIPPVHPGSPPPFYLPTAGMPYFAEIGGRYGYSWVVAQTQGSYGQTVSDSILVVWAGAPITITGVPTTTVTVPINGAPSATINITVKDVNGNPLPNGTIISATVSPGANPPTGWNIATSLNYIIPNAAYARFPGPSITDFAFNITNSSTGGIIPAGSTYQVVVTVSSEVELVTKYFNIIVQ
ncbi:MAG: Ig-like domain-containing protein, partial [Ignavibacteriales bacterium]|nr:Ig-like domain-containing protein [Ignavibacteriales bacterium]